MNHIRNISVYVFALLLILLSGCKSQKQLSNDYVVHQPEDEMNHIIEGLEESSNLHLLLEKAKEWLGTPYKYAHAEKGKGADCSGMVMKLYKEVYDIDLPRNSAKQAEYCNQISSNEANSGDLVFFATGRNRNRISHVGLMINKEQFIHASASRGVIISKISASYYKSRLIMFGRVPIKK